ncbi:MULTISPECIES: acyltransferase family protein [unclassified Robiginitalea]|uniref:acyltransferase family protein n=1 Tax=Robiginitalea TaxID=252306 RepID=UPI00234BEE70|nr:MULTISPECIES: acyltransferase family protein [unclassified Robiginitalea]MDC6352865.1 acyltransferase family protein [Robiginitalea sp. PM2]MDC6373968.1 acyltransferase family protein [Robiginitalea sp. SP8]
MNAARRYDLDWLRVGVFALLIFYHVGMFFVPWGWHVKNDVIYPELRWPMLFVNQWRLPILFVISGMGTYFAYSYRTPGRYALERLGRLGIPLVFGMLVIVPPQVYTERLAAGAFQGSYWEFLAGPAFSGVYPEGNISWHHLWFLPYLLLFSLVLARPFRRLRDRPGRLVGWVRRRLRSPWGWLVFILPLYIYEALMEPFFNVTHALIGDWFALANFGTLFFYGFVLTAAGKDFWDFAIRYRGRNLLIGILSFAALLVLWQFPDTALRHFTEAGLKVLNLWTWIFILFGYAAVYLNRPSNLLRYCNRAVYPFYILHQTLTVGIAYFLMDTNLGLPAEFAILSLGTFGGSLLIYHFLIRPLRVLHPFFGLKARKPGKKPAGRLVSE